jgi:hypothetical protein
MSEHLVANVPARTEEVHLPGTIPDEAVTTKKGIEVHNTKTGPSTVCVEQIDAEQAKALTVVATKEEGKSKKKAKKLTLVYSNPLPANEDLYDDANVPSPALMDAEDERRAEEEDDQWDDDGVESKIKFAKVTTARAKKAIKRP